MYYCYEIEKAIKEDTISINMEKVKVKQWRYVSHSELLVLKQNVKWTHVNKVKKIVHVKHLNKIK